MNPSKIALPLLAFAPLLISAPLLAPAGDFKLAGQDLTVPDGFEVELAASPPIVERPIEADFDELGRLYVTDSSGSNAKVEVQLKERPHRVLRLEDTDGDGRFDKRTVFADRMMFPEGCMWLDGSLYVAAPPSIWKLTDTDGDGVADQRAEWFQGKTLTGCANDLHGPYPGPDGWIYWAKGAFAKQSYDRPGKPPFVTRAAHIFRARPGNAAIDIEPVMTGGMDNPVGVAFTPGGERIITTTFFQHPEAGLRDGLIHAVYGGVYGKQHDVIDDHKRTGDLMPVLTHLGAAAPCGFTRYESRVFGQEYRDSFFATLFNLHKVTRHVLEPDGATFRSHDSDFLRSDSVDFHPTDVLEDADGSLLVVDTGGWYKLCCPTSQLPKPDVLGAIYRVRRKGAARIDDPRGLKLEWGRAEPGYLVSLLDDERTTVRLRSVAELAKRGAGATGALAAALRYGPTPEARRNAVWAATRVDRPEARDACRTALGDDDDEVRLAAIHSASARRDARAFPALLQILDRGPDRLRRAAAEALGRIGDAGGAVPSLLGAASTPNDRVLEHSLIYALIEIAEPVETLRGLEASSPRTRRAVLIALDQMDGFHLKPESVTPLLLSAEPVLKQTASWIVSHHPEWGGALAGFLRERLHAKDLSDGERAELEDQLARFARDGAVQELLAATSQAADTPGETRRTVLRAMARSELKETPASWAAEIARVLVGGGELDLMRQAVLAARALPAPKELKDASPELTAALLHIARDAAAPANLRLDALAAVPGGVTSVDTALFAFLRDGLDPVKPVLERAAAAGVIAKARLQPAQLLELAGVLKTAGPLEVPKLLPAFEKSGDETLGLKLVASLKDSEALSGLHPDMLKPVLAKYSAPVQARGEELLSLISDDAAKQREHLDEIASKLKGGDVRSGQAVFNGQKAACSTCHAIGYLGGKVGPDLTTIGQIRTERDFLESIVYPSASFVRSYEAVVVVTKAGEAHNGVLKRDGAEDVVLATSADKEVRIAREDIAEMRPSSVSIMPGGLDQQLTIQELADLLAFLKATKWGS